MEILKVDSLTKRFGGLTAIDGLSFTVEKGLIFGIIGPNGSGKTTLFNLIHGVFEPTEGSIVFDGQSTVGKKVHEVAAMGISRTFQATTIFQLRTVAENLTLASSWAHFHFLDSIFWRTKKYKETYEKHREHAYEVMKIIDLDSVRDSKAGDLSQEKQKRLAIGMVLATNPKMIMLDEPTGGIPVEETSGIVELIRKIHAKGQTILLIEHKMKVIMNLAETIMVLNYGKKIAEGVPDEIKKNEEVIKAYLGEDYVITEGY